MRTPLFLQTLLLTAFMSSICTMTACRKDRSGPTVAGGILTDRRTNKPIPFATIELLQCPSFNTRDERCSVRKSVQTDINGQYRIEFMGRAGSHYKLLAKKCDSIPYALSTSVIPGRPSPPMDISVTRYYPGFFRLIIRKNEAASLMLDGYKVLRSGAIDTTIVQWGNPAFPMTLRVAAVDPATQTWRGRKITYHIDPDNRAPIVVDIPDILLEPKLD